MSSTTHKLPLKMRANTAAEGSCDTAVALAEQSAGFVSFQWHQPSHPPTQNVNSAPISRAPAMQFSGNYAIYATTATTTAISVTF